MLGGKVLAAEENLNDARVTDARAAATEGGSDQPADDAHQAELALREQAYSELEGQFKRLAADFENFRRRAAGEREELIKFAGSRVLENLLPVVDNFERALGAMEKASEVGQVVTGVELIYRQLQDFLTKTGVAPMNAAGQPFDPNLHEAIAQVENLDLPDETVVAEAQKGYLYNGKVLRHAMVQVNRNPLAQQVNQASTPSTNSQNPAADAAAIKEEHHG